MVFYIITCLSRNIITCRLRNSIAIGRATSSPVGHATLLHAGAQHHYMRARNIVSCFSRRDSHPTS